MGFPKLVILNPKLAITAELSPVILQGAIKVE